MNKLINCKDSEINLFSLNNKEFICKIVNIYDADTCKVVFELNGELVKYTVRLKGLDTPEIRPKLNVPNREYEILAAKQARNRLIQLSTSCNIEIESDLSKKKIQKLIDENKKIIKIKCHSFDKYGRLLGTLIDCHYENKFGSNESNELNLNNILIDEGYAYSYDGGTKQKFDLTKFINKN